MNREEEYKQLLQALEKAVPATQDTLTRAKMKNRRNKRVVRSLVGLAAVSLCFVVLVNFCSPVAYACSKIPVLRELAEAVTISPSLTDAVENKYVQPIDLQQTDNGVTAKIEYLIVDQKQVNVFFRLSSNSYENLSAIPEVLQENGEAQSGYASTYSNFDTKNGQLQSITIDFIDSNVPESLRLHFNIEDNGARQAEKPTREVSFEDSLFDEVPKEPNYVANFDFLLEFDPTFTAQGKNIEINQTVTLGDQQIKLTNMEIYPTHLRLNVEDIPSNTAWLEQLDFYIETDDGMKFDTISNGISATGSENSPMMVSYRADSTYFYQADRLKIVITGAQWLDKNMKTVHLNLVTGEADRMPDDTEIDEVTQKKNGWIITVRAKERKKGTEETGAFYQVFMSSYYDPDGREGSIDRWTSDSFNGEDGKEKGYFCETFPLKDYPYHEVWLVPAFSHEWVAPDPIVTIVP
jgi:hypothetical protein